MRILIHSNAPTVPSGYGIQTKQLATRLQESGHEVAVSAFYGISGSPSQYRDISIYPAGMLDYGVDVLIPHALDFGADVVITLMDFWKLSPIATMLRRAPFTLAAWLPNDCTPLGYPDRAALSVSGAMPIAMSKFGLRNLQDAWPTSPWLGPEKTDVLYVPHSVNTKSEFYTATPEEREKAKAEIGVTGKFVVGINSANRDAVRKAWPEQFYGFKLFLNSYPESVLMVHTAPDCPSGLRLRDLASDIGIADEVVFSDQYGYSAGLISADMLREWYWACDVVSNCSYAEAFGIPIIEAQACGTPVVVTDGSAMTELAGPGWRVTGQKFWNPVHRAWWYRPDALKISQAFSMAHERADGKSERAREFSLGYDADMVFENYWLPALAELDARVKFRLHLPEGLDG